MLALALTPSGDHFNFGEEAGTLRTQGIVGFILFSIVLTTATYVLCKKQSIIKNMMQDYREERYHQQLRVWREEQYEKGRKYQTSGSLEEPSGRFGGSGGAWVDEDVDLGDFSELPQSTGRSTQRSGRDARHGDTIQEASREEDELDSDVSDQERLGADDEDGFSSARGNPVAEPTEATPYASGSRAQSKQRLVATPSVDADMGEIELQHI